MSGPIDTDLRARASHVMPRGVYGHMAVGNLTESHPQFFSRGEGARVWDVDGNEFVDLMCSWGPVILGHRDPVVDAAVREQLELGDCLDGPSAKAVELSESLVDLIPYADWVMYCKNGTDATTICIMTARAATGKNTILVANGSYHGSAPWCTPGDAGVTRSDRSNIIRYDYNDLASVHAAVAEADGDLAAIVVTPVRQELARDQEFTEPEFARGLRELCDREGAVLVLDEVRTGLRIDLRGTWESIGVRPDVSAWGKALANGQALSCVLGVDALRDPAASLFVTGSFWMSAVPMASALATIGVLRDTDAVARIERAGTRFREGVDRQAAAHRLDVTSSGPVQLPFMSFAGDSDSARSQAWAAACAEAGLYLHPHHNWFIGAAHSDADIDRALEATDAAFDAVAKD